MSQQEQGIATAKVKPRAYLREWRIHQGMTLQDVGDKMGLLRAQISSWETGARGITEKKLLRYCEAIGVDVSRIYQMPDAQSIDALLEGASPEIKSKAYLMVKLLLGQE